MVPHTSNHDENNIVLSFFGVSNIAASIAFCYYVSAAVEFFPVRVTRFLAAELNHRNVDVDVDSLSAADS